jgi:hypothetical protein
MSSTAAAAIVGLKNSRRPAYIWRGSVNWPGLATKIATTSSSNEVANAKRAPVATPGAMSGSTTRRKATCGGAPSVAAAFSRLRSNVCSVASTVIST